MFNRCEMCHEKCPDFSTLCDTCYRIMLEDAWINDYSLEDKIMDEEYDAEASN